jgi:hypothetical protein
LVVLKALAEALAARRVDPVFSKSTVSSRAGFVLGLVIISLTIAPRMGGSALIPLT